MTATSKARIAANFFKIKIDIALESKRHHQLDGRREYSTFCAVSLAKPLVYPTARGCQLAY